MSLEMGLVTTVLCHGASKCQEKILKILPCESSLQFLTGCRGEVCWPGYLFILWKTYIALPPKRIGSSVASISTPWFRDPQTLQTGSPVLLPCLQIWWARPTSSSLPPAPCVPCTPVVVSLLQGHPCHSSPHLEEVGIGREVIAAKTYIGTEARKWWHTQSG